ncbi:unnamed protein product [Ixodes pacificus]
MLVSTGHNTHRTLERKIIIKKAIHFHPTITFKLKI